MIPKPGTLRFIKATIYDLKKQYGIPGDIYKIEEVENNIETGKMIVTKSKHKIKKLIVLPKSYAMTKFYSLSYIAANKNFTYGGFFNRDIKIFLIDRSDLKVEIKLNDYIVVKHERYEVRQIEDLELDMGYIVFANKIDGQPTEEIYDVNIKQTLKFEQETHGS